MKKKTSTTKDIPESLKGLYKKSSSLEDIQKAIKLQTVTQKQKQ